MARAWCRPMTPQPSIPKRSVSARSSLASAFSTLPSVAFGTSAPSPRAARTGLRFGTVLGVAATLDGRMRRSDDTAPGYAQPPGCALRSPPDSPSPHEHGDAVETSVHSGARVPACRGDDRGSRESVFVQVGYQVVVEAHAGGGLGRSWSRGSAAERTRRFRRRRGSVRSFPRQRRHHLPGSEVVGAFERVDRKILSSNRKRPPGYRSGLRSRSRTRSDRKPQ
jgi:hypothetical protein